MGKNARVTFYKCIQDSQDYGSDDEHMVSRIFFFIEIDEKRFDLHADIKQTVGSSFETGPIEVRLPEYYRGPINYDAFRDAAEKYYRSLVGSLGRGISIQGGTNIRMRNNIFIQEMTAEFEVEEGSAGW
jgi:hypothetical protein